MAPRKPVFSSSPKTQKDAISPQEQVHVTTEMLGRSELYRLELYKLCEGGFKR
jgi:hypothetical protein